MIRPPVAIYFNLRGDGEKYFDVGSWLILNYPKIADVTQVEIENLKPLILENVNKRLRLALTSDQMFVFDQEIRVPSFLESIERIENEFFPLNLSAFSPKWLLGNILSFSQSLERISAKIEDNKDFFFGIVRDEVVEDISDFLSSMEKRHRDSSGLEQVHRPIYKIHKYEARKDWNVADSWIKCYSGEGDVVLDPFCGSGVFPIEALKLDRRSIAIDLNDVATFITEMTVVPVDLENLLEAFEELKTTIKGSDKIQPKRYKVKFVQNAKKTSKQITFDYLYETICYDQGCTRTAHVAHSVWSNIYICPLCSKRFVMRKARVIKRRRGTRSEYACPHCDKRIDLDKIEMVGEEPFLIFFRCSCDNELREKAPDQKDSARIKEIEGMKIPFWYPKGVKFRYADGKNFLQLRHGVRENPSLERLFSKRNLIALSILLHEIENVKDKNIRNLLRLNFTSHLKSCSRMSTMNVGGWRSKGTGLSLPFYWVPHQHLEENVWENYERYFWRKLVRAKKESFMNYVKSDHHKAFRQGKGNFLLICGDAIETLKDFDDNSVDFVITDPPYAESMQYGELCFLWYAWLGYGKVGEEIDDYIRNYVMKMKISETVKNSQQGKGDDDFENMLYVTFMEVSRVLKPNRWMAVTFHNPSFKIRNILEKSAFRAGFDLERVIYQKPFKQSHKGLIHPYGSIEGNFYFRFKNKKKFGRQVTPDEKSFERIVVDATVKILAERGQPTPMPMVSNAIEPELSRYGFPFSEKNTIEKVILQNVGKLFLVQDTEGNLITPKKLGNKVIWFTPEEAKTHLLDRVPLSDRVEILVSRLLRRRRVVSFSEVMEALFTRFPNSLTPDIDPMKYLERYAVAHGKKWKIAPIFDGIVKKHSQFIAILAKLGKSFGFKVWVGRREQSDIYKTIRLKELCDFDRLLLKDIPTESLQKVSNIDLLWIEDDLIAYTFEIENTTAITDAIRRNKHIPYPKVKRVIVMPKEKYLKNRIEELQKIGIIQKAELGEWRILYYDELETKFNSEELKELPDLENLLIPMHRLPTFTKEQASLQEWV